MAAIKWSAIGVTDGRGTSGGTTFSNGAGGAYIRRRVKATNPQSQAQTAQRARFSQQAQAWRALTDAERADWDGAAKSGQYPLKTLLGDTIQPSGSILYNTLNNIILSAGGSVITAVPLQVGLGDVLVTAAAGAAGTPALTLTYTGTLGSDEVLVVFASYGVSNGRAKGSNWKKIGAAGFSGASPVNVLAAYTAVWGPLTEGARVFLKAFLVNDTTGESRLAGEVSAIIAA